MKIISHISTRATRGRNLTLVWGVHPFPAGKILVALSAEGLCWLGINCGFADLAKNWAGAEFVEDKKLTEKAAKDIARLWPGRLERLSIPVVLYGTPFQLKVWKELLRIKSGATVTYEQIARKIGAPKAARAAGSAIGKNPVAVVVPCHRVVNKTGGRISFGWGPTVKTALLKGEKAA
jgi:AraC family transcriptional regulator of adaptative response/methylated-DNA-[protein]-cysteine methyltransferase